MLGPILRIEWRTLAADRTLAALTGLLAAVPFLGAYSSEPSLQKEPKSSFLNGQSGTPVCSGCSAFSRCSRRYRPALEPLKCGSEMGAPNCSKCSPFRPFAPKPME